MPPKAGFSAPAVAETGQALPASVRSFFEPKFHCDLSPVRIHTGREASQSARALKARAFTLGSHIVFGARQYAPESKAGRKLLAHELIHVLQQAERSATPERPIIYRDDNGEHQPSEPDITFKGHYTFYLPELAKSGRKDGFVAQFTMVDDPSNTVGGKFLYQPTRHLREFQLQLPPDQVLRPKLLQQSVNSATFDLNGDGSGDLEVLLAASGDTEGIRVYITSPGQTVDTYIIPPPKRRIVPERGYPMGTLPNGKKYYLQPWTYHLPGGPRYVDEDGRGVNPGLEFQAAATLDTMMKGYLFSLGALAAIGAGAIILPELAGSAVVAGGVARGAGAIRWLFSGTRLVAGGTSAAANLATQAMEHGAEWERYNWGSVGFDYVMGAISYSVAKSVVTRWPAPLFSRKIGDLQTWVNFGKQQAVLALYGTLVGAIRAQVSNTSTGATVGAQHAEGLIQMTKSIGLQTFLASPTGKRLFPAGFDDPRIAFISRSLTFITKLAIREVFDVVPQSSESAKAQGEQ